MQKENQLTQRRARQKMQALKQLALTMSILPHNQKHLMMLNAKARYLLTPLSASHQLPGNNSCSFALDENIVKGIILFLIIMEFGFWI